LTLIIIINHKVKEPSTVKLTHVARAARL